MMHNPSDIAYSSKTPAVKYHKSNS